ncbi:hypothetical protein [Lichenifustis flavocetrariae]|uniref:Uncharacterized protein n=1 Tax=Lichenifustis flavocetrariae TaxID=2949735 RepID=A0AA42CMF9_9HYPH|nr:hypothetical protein [Lichenifustis flavocetrariae]MCW6508342.1 hypothetical protein [Lichenifustis flavocetrariae]
MPDTSNSSRLVGNQAGCDPGLTITFTHPDDVLHSRVLSLAEKRAVLAGWASDAHAVPNLPSLRQLDSGAIVSIDTVLEALRSLDATPDTSTAAPRVLPPKLRAAVLSRWRRPSRRGTRDDDDEPPPCPAAALPPGVELELRRRRDENWRLAAA